jgi:hypothetical protein
MHEHEAEGFGITDELADAGQETDVESADGFVRLTGIGVLPMDDTEAVVENGRA